MRVTVYLVISLLGISCLPGAAPAFAQTLDATRSQVAPILSKAPWDGPAVGALPIAILEAQTALSRARLAAGEKEADAIREYANDVLSAVDPAEGKSSVSLGFGVKRAMQETLAQLALTATDSKPDAQILVPRAAAAARNVMRWCDELVSAAQAAGRAKAAEDAAPHVAAMNRIAQQVLIGRDANGDGRITDATGEGGLFAIRSSLGMLLGARDAAAQANKRGAR